MKGRELFIHLSSLAISGAGLLVGIRNDLWGLVGNDPVNVGFGALGLAVLLLLGGERVALESRLSGTELAISEEVNRLGRSFPSVTLITRFRTSDEALVELSHRLSGAKVTLNTRVSRDGVRSGDNAHKTYHQALHSAIKNGAMMVDLVSPNFDSEAKKLQNIAGQPRSQGQYSYYSLDPQVSCFLNFTIIEYAARNPELWIGWATSRVHGIEQPAFRILDKDVISYFRAYHEALRSK